jgi:hypothetical protein
LTPPESETKGASPSMLRRDSIASMRLSSAQADLRFERALHAAELGEVLRAFGEGARIKELLRIRTNR